MRNALYEHSAGDASAVKEMRFARPAIESWIADVLVRAGLAAGDAALVAENLLDAECRHVRSHGVLLLPLYVDRIRNGGIRSPAHVTIASDAQAVVVLDGGGGAGQVAADRAIAIGLERVRRYGVCYVGIRNSNHVGMLASYGLRVARAGFVALVFTNSGPAVSVTRGRGRRVGNNALCIACPGEAESFVIDMAAGAVACGKVRLAALLDAPVADGWLEDRDGRPSRCARDLDRGGAMLPAGSYKGYCLAALVDVLTALLTGGRPSLRVASQRHDYARPTGACQAFLFLNPDATAGHGCVTAAVTSYMRDLRETERRDPNVPVLAPGDPELQAQSASTDGISIGQPLVDQLDTMAARLGSAPVSAIAQRGGTGAADHVNRH